MKFQILCDMMPCQFTRQHGIISQKTVSITARTSDFACITRFTAVIVKRGAI